MGFEEAHTGRDVYVALNTPVTIELEKATHAFVEHQVFVGAALAPVDVTGIKTQMTRIQTVPNTDGSYKLEISGDIGAIHTISFPSDIKLEDIKCTTASILMEAIVVPIVGTVVSAQTDLAGNREITFNELIDVEKNDVVIPSTVDITLSQSVTLSQIVEVIFSSSAMVTNAVVDSNIITLDDTDKIAQGQIVTLSSHSATLPTNVTVQSIDASNNSVTLSTNVSITGNATLKFSTITDVLGSKTINLGSTTTTIITVSSVTAKAIFAYQTLERFDSSNNRIHDSVIVVNSVPASPTVTDVINKTSIKLVWDSTVNQGDIFTFVPRNRRTVSVRYYNGSGNDIIPNSTTATVIDPNGDKITNANGNDKTVTFSSATATRVTLNDSVDVGSRLIIEIGTYIVGLSQIQKSFQRTRDIRLGLRWPGRTEDHDFTISGNYEYSSARDVNTITSLDANDPDPSIDDYNAIMTESELEDTYIPSAGNGIEAQMLPIHKVNDADQSDEMMFCGHFMNVDTPSRIVGQTNTNSYFKNGLGWETSIVHQPTKYVMPAFPYRDSVVYTVDAAGVEGLPDVMPLVARILNAQGSKAFFDCKCVNNTIDDYKTSTNFTHAVHYESRSVTQATSNTQVTNTTPGYVQYKNSIVVTIGSQRYVVKKAYYISTLQNRTKYTLDMSCQNGNQPLQPIEFGDSTNFFASSLPLKECKYFTWCFELDREVLLPTGLSTKAVPLSKATASPPISDRTFKGIADEAAMFCPSCFYRNTGRIALSKFQDAPHRFYVRHTGCGLSERQQPIMRLHGIGNMEYPVNSSKIMGHSDSFALLGAEVDQKKPLAPCVPSYVAFKSPLNINRLSFSFTTIDGDEYVLKQNATFMFDVFAEND